MAVVKPFQGIRYDSSVVGNVAEVVSPPYDVISPADRVYYHEKHPNNFVRLILGEELPGDDEKSNRFTRAGEYLRQWLAEGVLKQDSAPAMYAYEQEYSRDGRTFVVRGFTLLVRIEEYDKGIVLPHENTLAKPKSDLIRLIRESRANLDSVYGLYPDPEQTLTAILNNSASTPPAVEVTDRDSVRHRLWVLDSPETVGRIESFLADKEIVIADGHHRYETTMALRDEMRAQDPSPSGDKPYDYLMMTIVNVYGRDVTVFPTHRMVRNLANDAVSKLPRALESRFSIEEIDSANIIQAMSERQGKSIGMVTQNAARLLTLKVDPVPLIGKAKALSELDLSILHRLILEDGLGIDDDRLKHETNIVYTRDEQEAIGKVRSGEFQIAFLLNPVKVESILDVARAGEKMPQKATYFYPKLISGLVLRQM